MVKVHGLQIRELVEVRQKKVTLLVYLLSDSLVKGNDMEVLRVPLGDEILQDVSLIQFEFFCSMSKGKEIYITGDVKSNCHLSMCGDGFGSILGSKLEFNFSNVLVIGGCGVKS